MKTRLKILALLYIMATGNAFAQPEILNKVPPPENQTFGSAMDVTQDLDGFMWFATRTGLYKYDGYQYTVFRNDPLNTNSLVNDSINSIAVDSSGNIWIGTINGLDMLDPTTGQFKHYHYIPENPGSLNGTWINKLFVDSEGTLWIGSAAGLERYIKETDSFRLYCNIPGDLTSLSYNGVSAIYEDKQRTIWVGTGSVWFGEEEYDKGGLNRMDKEKGTFTRYLHDSDNPESLINNIVTAIYEDSKGTFWVGTAGDGLHTMDREKGTFVRHTHDPNQPEKLSRPPFNHLLGDAQKKEFITFIKEDITGAIWIGSRVCGMNYYNPNTEKISNFKTNKYFEPGHGGIQMPGNMFISSERIIWISSHLGNIYRIKPERNRIPHFVTPIARVGSFHEEDNKTLWILTNSEIIGYNKEKEITKRIIIDFDPIGNVGGQTIKILKKDSQGNLWIGGRNGLYRWDKKNDSLINYPINKGKVDISGNIVWSIYEDREANLWIGKPNGLTQIKSSTGSVTQFPVNSNNSPPFEKYGVTSVLYDKFGKLWIGAWGGGGLFLYIKETGQFKNYLIGNISHIYEDTDGNLWVASTYDLYKYNQNSDSFIIYKDPNLSTGINEVRSIVEDNHKNLWIGTINGIISLNIHNNESKIYGKNDGVENNLLWFSAYKGKDGKLYFGDDTGYYSFYPTELTKNNIPPRIVLSKFFLENVIIKQGKNSLFNGNLTNATEIRLGYNQNVFSFEFAVIDYADPERNQLLYYLENYDVAWRKGNDERRAYYFNVPPGNYVFRVKAANSSGIWAEKKIDVIIMPPWWKTWWAYAIYAILFITAVFGVDRFQRARLLQKEKEKNRQRELAHAMEIEKAYTELKSTQAQLIQSEKMASLGELTAGIAHEIQNPLNFVNNFSDVSEELVAELREELNKGDLEEAKVISNDVIQNLQKIKHHGQRASDIVKGMLAHSRTSSGQKEPTDINALADEYLRLAYHGLRAKDKSFNAEFVTDFDESLPKINVIPQDIGRVLLNLINNAFYAVDKRAKENVEGYKPEIVVSTSSSPLEKGGIKGGLYGVVTITVSDNGPGIPSSIVDKIFQPFFTTKPTGQGTGLGLSLSYDIVKAHGGELRVETKEGIGTEFTIIIPI
jgi:signal transduction histidine kinase/ligand-binding sensor domain-containing protein